MMRTDIHRPSAIQPEDYIFVAFECLPGANEDPMGWASAQQAEREMIKAHMKATGGTYSHHAHGGNCMICGNANAIYTALFYHEKTNSYVRVGRDCADKLDASGLEWNAFTARVKDVLAARAGKRKAEAVLAGAGLTKAWEIYESDRHERQQYEEETIFDIVSKLVKYGSISEKQESFLRTLLDRIERRAEIEAQRKAENEAAEPAPTGRVEVSGDVLSTKVQDGYYGTQFKMMVKTDAGWKLWVTVPMVMLSEVETLRGRRVTLKVTVEPSKDDPKFAFGKRPSLVKLEEGRVC